MSVKVHTSQCSLSCKENGLEILRTYLPIDTMMRIQEACYQPSIECPEKIRILWESRGFQVRRVGIIDVYFAREVFQAVGVYQDYLGEGEFSGFYTGFDGERGLGTYKVGISVEKERLGETLSKKYTYPVMVDP